MTYPPDTTDLDAWFPRVNGTDAPRLGVVVGGSLSKGLVVKLDRGIAVEDLAVGRYVVVRVPDDDDPEKTKARFFCMLTDIVLNNTNPAIQAHPPELANDPFLRDIYIGTAAYGTVTVTPMLSIEDDQPRPVKSIPGHFMPVHNASVEDVNAVFGAEDEAHFNVGAPLELETTQINLDLKRLVERSIGVFGKSGTGKSFLTRMLIAGIIKWGKAVNLIFDMHNDYGWAGTNEGGQKAKGLKQLFNSQVVIITLDGESTRRRNAAFDFEVKLGYDEIDPEDIAALRGSMNLTDAMIDAAYTLKKRWKGGWIKRFLHAEQLDFDDITMNTNIAEGTLLGLQRRLQRFERWSFLVEESTGDSVQKILNLLIDGQKNVVLEFGRYGNELEAYILVANYLTRRIRDRYVDMVERSLGDEGHKPPQLLITIEEAHKFLQPGVAEQTIFGVIARELRKYNVTLLIVDQRPSGIDEEVMSQVGTRVTALLDNDKDITAVLTGINNANSLREVLARLDTKQQAIIMGHAVPMPVVVKTRNYDQAFYEAITVTNHSGNGAARDRLGAGKKERRL
ncbi:MAG TPA: ATP-binding protein [Aggregatilineales bacterium]|nr:ATP-binding protein [Anaerolineae bacterium]HUN07344.1 ATP-binding protein [Aggregatilineales bacterium]